MKNLTYTKVLLNSVSKVKEFTEIASQYKDSHLDLVSGRYRVAAKSLMGIFSLNLLKPIMLEFDESCKELVERLFKEFIV